MPACHRGPGYWSGIRLAGTSRARAVSELRRVSAAPSGLGPGPPPPEDTPECNRCSRQTGRKSSGRASSGRPTGAARAAVRRCRPRDSVGPREQYGSEQQAGLARPRHGFWSGVRPDPSGSAGPARRMYSPRSLVAHRSACERGPASCQLVRPVCSRRRSRTSVYQATRASAAPAAIRRADAPERYLRMATPSSSMLTSDSPAESRALMRSVTWTSSATISGAGSVRTIMYMNTARLAFGPWPWPTASARPHSPGSPPPSIVSARSRLASPRTPCTAPEAWTS